MLFDKLCGIAEREMRCWEPLLRRAALFCFEKSWPEIPKGDVPDFPGLFDDFFTPFPTVAVEDPDGVVVMEHLELSRDSLDLSPRSLRRNRENRLEIARHCDELVEAFAYSGSQVPSCLRYRQEPGFTTRSMIRTLIGYRNPSGAISMIGGWSILQPNGEMLHATWATACLRFPGKTGIAIHSDPEKMEQSGFEKNQLAKSLKDCSGVGMRQCAMINHPGRWVVKEVGDSAAKRLVCKGKKIPRSHQRPIYRLITDEERKRCCRVEERIGKRNSPIPHARRAHWRTIGRDPETGQPMFTKVKATWIGSRVAVVKGRRYEVQVDL